MARSVGTTQGLSRMASALPTEEVGFAKALAELLDRGRSRGSVTTDDITSLLRSVELEPELIEAVIGLLRQEGIAYDGDDQKGSDSDDKEATPSRRPPSTGGSAPAHKGRRAVSTDGTEDDGDQGAVPDPVRLYLKEIGKVPLLSAEEEVSLARRIEAGLAAAERIAHLEDAGSGTSSVPADEVHELEQVVFDGLQAKQDLINANLRLVVSIAKRYRNAGMAFLDLIQEGNVGLMRAVDKFDYTKGFKFSTYATWWIRQSITRAIADQARTIRIPVHMVETLHKVGRTERQLVQELGREPTVEELSARVDMTPARVRELLRIGQDTVSLEQPMGDQDFSLGDMIEDESAVVPSAAAARTLLNQAVKQALSELSDRERQVVRMRFGLDDGQARTLEEVGRAFGVTRERVRQIEGKVLAKLRDPMRSQRLRDYLVEE